jgi:aryl carrier-like protein
VDEEFNSEAIFLAPNLGCPILLNFLDRKKEEFRITSLACSNSENLDNLIKMLLDSIKLIPLFESKWKQRRERRKFRFKFWKKPNMMNPSIHTNIIRGDPIELKIIQSEPFTPSFDEFIELDHYRKKGILTGNCFQILLEFSINKEVK